MICPPPLLSNAPLFSPASGGNKREGKFILILPPYPSSLPPIPHSIFTVVPFSMPLLQTFRFGCYSCTSSLRVGLNMNLAANHRERGIEMQSIIYKPISISK